MIHAVSSEERERLLAEFIRICAPGGAIYFQTTDMRAPIPRFSWYPPTLAKRAWRAANNFFVWRAAMEMHSLPRAEVEAIVRASGAEFLRVDERHGTGKGFESCTYLARKK